MFHLCAKMEVVDSILLIVSICTVILEAQKNPNLEIRQGAEMEIA